jgi:NAD(P)-dependent dehydrogenase (short-subunit alcohol dehydrogenase family)
MKTIIVTGANSGLGLWTTKYLLDLDYRVIMACRNIEITKVAITNFHQFNRSKNYIIMQLDLADFQSIASFVASLPKDQKIYGIDCNAGLINTGAFSYTKNGVEKTFGVNHLGHFYLINLLLTKFDIQKIVIISSALHDPTNLSPMAKAAYKKVDEMAYPKFDLKTSVEKQNQAAYSTSKLCNVLFAYELAKRVKGVTSVNAFNPGLMPLTNFGRTGKIWYAISMHIIYFFGVILGFATNPKKSAKYVVRLLNEESGSGLYFEKDKSISSSLDSYDPEKAQELWKDSESLILSILKRQ